MVNGYYDFATGTAFIPYLGAGIGVSRINVDASLVGANRVNSSGTGSGLQGIAGVGYQLDDNWTGSLEYRYYTLQDVEVNLSNGSRVDADYILLFHYGWSSLYVWRKKSQWLPLLLHLRLLQQNQHRLLAIISCSLIGTAQLSQMKLSQF